jgi:hypothetical protein
MAVPWLCRATGARGLLAGLKVLCPAYSEVVFVGRDPVDFCCCGASRDFSVFSVFGGSLRECVLELLSFLSTFMGEPSREMQKSTFHYR